MGPDENYFTGFARGRTGHFTLTNFLLSHRISKTEVPPENRLQQAAVPCVSPVAMR